ncbi:hypothetical protein ElyMa_001370200 [Elysia marginata]|uniref:Uncharacterized protein n=1 Tax=Elysia marginata TaxID=1093978 RepID=A0AAV4IPZ2_9GAST|nr:hypothetical protein ElyMa_001370200 [Elysia marginata]
MRLSNTEDRGPSVDEDFGKILSADVTSTHAEFTYQVETKTHHSRPPVHTRFRVSFAEWDIDRQHVTLRINNDD